MALSKVPGNLIRLTTPVAISIDIALLSSDQVVVYASLWSNHENKARRDNQPRKRQPINCLCGYDACLLH
jgi:hypothetical protein